MPYRSRRMQSRLELWFRSQFTLRNLSIVFIPVILILIIAPLVLGLILESIYAPRIYTDAAKLTSTRVGVIPSFELVNLTDNSQDISTAVKLYKAGKIQKLLLSGNSVDNVTALQNLVVTAGVPAQDIKTDSSAKRIYDMCYRLKSIFSLDAAVIISTSYDLSQILFICNSLNVSASGFYEVVDGPALSFGAQVRQLISLGQAVWQVNVAPPQDVARGDKVNL